MQSRHGAARAILGLCLLLAVACGGEPGDSASSEADDGQPSRGGTLVVTTPADFDSFNPLISTSYDTNELQRHLLFMTLVRYGDDLEVEPYLAERWELADDGLSVTYHIRKDVKWHDGTPTTAADVLFTYQRAIEPAVGYPNVATFAEYTGGELLDDYTVRFTFAKPIAEPVENIALLPIAPKHLLENVKGADMRNYPFARTPVGNGPYKFVRWTANQEVVLEANDAFSPSLGGQPWIDRVVYRIVPEQTTEVSMLLSGQSDLMRAVPPQDAKRVEESDRARLMVYPHRQYVYVAWNPRLPLFDTANERRAMTYAIDRKRMIDALMYGYGDLAATHTFLTSWTQDPSIEALPYDPERAKQLLSEEGWRDTNGDGVLDQNGRRFEFNLMTNEDNDLRADMLVLIKDDLAKIGVVARPVLREWTVLLEETQRKDYDAFVSGWVPDFTYDPRDLFHSEAIDGRYNFVSFANPTADSLIDLGTATPRREEAKPIWSAFQRLLAEEQPYTWCYLVRERVGLSNRVHGVKPMDARGHIRQIPTWWLTE